MRTMMFVRIPVEAGNRAIKDGSLPKVIDRFIETYHPEASYFITRDGERCPIFVFDLKHESQIPVLCEPFFSVLQARIEFCPAMNADDVKAGLASAAR